MDKRVSRVVPDVPLLSQAELRNGGAAARSLSGGAAKSQKRREDEVARPANIWAESCCISMKLELNPNRGGNVLDFNVFLRNCRSILQTRVPPSAFAPTRLRDRS